MKSLAVVVLIVVALFSNPSVDAHVSAVLSKQIPFGNILGEGDFLLSYALRSGTRSKLNYVNCLFFSFTTEVEGNYPASIGIFGFVKAL